MGLGVVRRRHQLPEKRDTHRSVRSEFAEYRRARLPIRTWKLTGDGILAMDRRDIDAELDRVTADFHHLLDSATGAELAMSTKGTRWTNKQLLFHMLFGFILVRALLPLVKGFGRLPLAASRTFAAILNAGTRPFHVVNYLSALPGGAVLGRRAMENLMDTTIRHLRRRLARESERTLGLAMHFPIGWDPYFKDVMTVGDVYHYPTQHYEHHRRQLTTRRALES
jgi:hypothetical protein